MKPITHPLIQPIIFILAFLLVGITFITAQPTQDNHPITIPLRFDYYYSYDMIVQALQKLNQTYPHLTQLEVAGKSEEGRNIYCMTINNPKTGDKLDKPGIYVDGNIHGNEIQAAEVGLYLLDYLLGNYGKNAEITQLIDSRCFYVVPTVNPDGRDHFLNDGNTDSSNRSIRIPSDDDRDGLYDEDFPDDLDKDGNICIMRKKDPFGSYKTDPNDPRMLLRVKPGEKGEWTILGEEGIDNDDDGKINEDSEGYLDGNRNWGYDWMPNYVQAGAGNFPFSGSGLKGLAEFIRQRPNICIAWAFHNFGGMYLRGPSTKSQTEYNPLDIKVYDYLGQQAERISPGYRYLISWKDLYSTYGDFSEWMAMTNGAYSFVGELSPQFFERFISYQEKENQKSSDKPSNETEESQNIFKENTELERQRLKFNDHLTQNELFKPWHPFKHPVYGDIEIGGWIKLSTRIPAPFMIKDMVHRNASAVIFSAKHTPNIHLDILDTQPIGQNIYRIRIRLSNSAAMPTMTYHAQSKKLYPMDMLSISGPQVTILAGGILENLYTDEATYKEFRPEIQFLVVPGFGKIDYQFLVSGSGQVNIHYHSRHAGKITRSISLK